MLKVLIVEDEPKISDLLKRGFRKNGFTVTVASDGEQAIQAAQTDDYAVILLDLGLPLQDGWAVLKDLRERGNRSPVIVVTASDTSLRDILAAGANDLVLKPFKFRDLLVAVRRQIEPPNLMKAQFTTLRYKYI